MTQTFEKRIYSGKSFFGDLHCLLRHLPRLIHVLTDPKIKKLIWKILIVTDVVNGCAYCTWIDAKLALKNGISPDSIKKILRLEFQTEVSDDEAFALLYAQHFAETHQHPDPQLTGKLFKLYGEKTAGDILLALRAATFGNLYFNTWDAIIRRFRGMPAPKNNLVFALFFFISNIFLFPFLIIFKMFNKSIFREESTDST